MNPSPQPARHRTGLITILFTDLVGSTALKQQVGDRTGASLMQQHHALVRELLREFPGGEEVETAGDSFLIVFTKPSDAVHFGLRLHARLRALNQGLAAKLEDRIGIHVGEVVIREQEGSPNPKGLMGIQVDTCARVMGLAQGGQILLTRSAFDNARQMLKGEDVPGVGPLEWLNHGPYSLKGIEASLEVCEVGEVGIAPLQAPAGSDKAQRQVTPESEPVLGWRPALGQFVPNTRWRLETKLGEGGFGEVWLGRNPTTKERRVFKFCFQAERVRFLKRELTLFRLLKERIGEHPNLVRLHDVYLDQPPFYVEMDYVEGADLRSWCEGHGGVAGVPLETRLEIVAQAADGLQAAHEAGIIHRDIKPANILIGSLRSEAGGPRAEVSPLTADLRSPTSGLRPLIVKLTDFGIGQVVSEEYLQGITRAGFTQTILSDSSSSHTGTQLYMAPELLAGKPATIRSDIYSLGVVLYQLVVGDFTCPVTGDWSDDITDALLRDDLQHCLAGKPGDRFAGAGQLAKHLRALPERRAALEQQQAELAARERAAYRRGMMRTAGLAVVVIALVTGLAMVALDQSRKAKATARRESSQRQRADQERQRAEASEQSAQRLLYASDMNLALGALEAKNVGFALRLLDRHKPKPGQSDLRGWEWRYVWKQTRSDALQTLGSHSNTVYDAVFSPKGDLLATCSEDHTVRVWELTTRREPALLRHPAAVGAAGFSSDGTKLVTACADGNLRLWDVISRGELRRIGVGKIGADRSRNTIAFSRGAGLFAFGDETGTVQVWDVARGTRTASLHGTGLPYSSYCLAFSPDGGLLAAGHLIDGDGTVDLWDLSRSERVCSLTNDSRNVSSLTFSSDGKMLACAGWGDSATITLWDLAVRRAGRPLTGHSGWITAMAFLPDDKTLASASIDHTVRLWNLGTGEGAALRGDLNEVWAMAMAPDGRTLATGTKVDGTVTLWSTRPKPAEATTQRIGAWSDSPSEKPVLSPDGTALLQPSKGNTIRVWDSATLAETANFPLEFSEGTHFAISPFGKLIAVGDPDGAVKLVEVSSRREIARLAAGGAAIEHVAFSRDGNKLAAAAAGRKLRIWAIATRKLLCETEGHTNDVNKMGSAFLFSTDGTTLGVGYEDKTAEIFDVSSGRRWAFLQGHKAPVSGAILLADGETVATASYDQALKLWAKGTQQELRSLTGESQSLFALALSPDGQRLATGGSEGTLRLWDAATSQLVALIKGSSKEWIMSLAFSADGNTLVAITTGMLRVWRAPSWAEIEAAEKADAQSQPR